MCVALRGAGAYVAQQSAKNRQTETRAGTETRVGVPQVVNAQARELGPFSDRTPRSVQVGTRLLAVRASALAGDDVSTDAFQSSKHCERRCIQDNRFRASLTVRQQKQAAFKIHMWPFQPKDFAQPGTGQDQEPDRGRRERIDDGPAFCLLWRVLGRSLGLVDGPRQSNRLGFPDCVAEPAKFVTGQKSLAAFLRNLSIPRAGLKPADTSLRLPANA